MVDLRALCVVNPSCKGRWWKWKAMIDEEEGSKEPDRELIDDYEYFKMGSSQLKCSVFTKLGFEPL